MVPTAALTTCVVMSAAGRGRQREVARGQGGKRHVKLASDGWSRCSRSKPLPCTATLQPSRPPPRPPTRGRQRQQDVQLVPVGARVEAGPHDGHFQRELQDEQGAEPRVDQLLGCSRSDWQAAMEAGQGGDGGRAGQGVRQAGRQSWHAGIGAEQPARPQLQPPTAAHPPTALEGGWLAVERGGGEGDVGDDRGQHGAVKPGVVHQAVQRGAQRVGRHRRAVDGLQTEDGAQHLHVALREENKGGGCRAGGGRPLADPPPPLADPPLPLEACCLTVWLAVSTALPVSLMSLSRWYW